MITVISGHPRSSKWWWNGAMRKIRRPKRRKLSTWRITDAVSATKSPPMHDEQEVEVHQKAQRAEARADGERRRCRP